MDYQGNAKKAQEPGLPAKPPKKIEKVITGEVITKKKPLGRTLKEFFIAGDAKNVAAYVFKDVLLPAAKNMIFDAGTEGLKRTLYGDRGVQRRNTFTTPSRYSYNLPVQRPRDPLTNPPMGRIPAIPAQVNQSDIILTSKEEAETVLQSMFDIINQYEAVSVADLHEMVGLPAPHTDNKWGWTHLVGSSVKQVRDGFLLDLPAPEPI